VAIEPLDSLFISSVSVAEIRYGAEIHPDAQRRADLRDWLRLKIRPMFANRILPISEDVLLRWRLLVGDGRKAGITFSQPDLFIAATALEHGLTIVTRDEAGFNRTGAEVLNPWIE
jgi:predicted nucleic acid-binding protein